MRTLLFLAALLIAIALVALVVAGRERGGEAGAPGRVLLVGDSLNVGVEPYLAPELAGWELDAHDRVGRVTAEGVEELRAGGLRLAPYVVVSLGTNDPPADAGAFRERVRQVQALVGPARCLVWATIYRGGSPGAVLNQVLRQAAASNRRLRLVEWAEMVQRHPEWLAPDGLHGTETGYRERARAIATAVRGCAPGTTVEPR